MPVASDNNHLFSKFTRSVSPQNSASPLISDNQRRAREQIDKEPAQSNSGDQKKAEVGRDAGQQDMAAMEVPLSSEVTASLARPESPYLEPAAELKPRTKPLPIQQSRLPQGNNAAAGGILGSSPGRFRSASPRLHSPASSEIFERNVQEPVPIAGEPSAHLPSHVMTEDHIPPALEASAQAITSQDLNADEVKIVTSSSHQTAAASVLENSTSQLDMPSLGSPLVSQKSEDTDSAAQSQQLPNHDDTATYGSIDPTDVRRLSFISFADVVLSEHQHPAAASTGSDVGSVPASIMASSIARVPSPLRSPQSPASSIGHPASGLATPPLVAARAIAGAESSPSRGLTPGAHGELTIETMRQAVRKTASGDLGINPTLSPTTGGDEIAHRSRTNS